MIFRFWLPMFPIRVTFYSGKEEFDEFSKRSGMAGCADDLQGASLLPHVWVKNANDTGLIVHELHHLTDQAAQFLAIPGREFKFHLQEYMFNKIQARLRKESGK
jgi:hypothetical protein